MMSWKNGLALLLMVCAASWCGCAENGEAGERDAAADASGPAAGAEAHVPAPEPEAASAAAPEAAPATAVKPPPATQGELQEVQPGPTLLLAQAQFVYVTDASGKRRPKPGPARLVILQQRGPEWKRQVLEDPDSNVFHKAIICDHPAGGEERGILTIGANRAVLKFWTPSATGWQGKTLWQGEFGGKQDRLRDFEIGDVTGDGQDDIVIVTHDQGVVLVLSHAGDGWEAQEIDRKPDTFIHEVELGDLDGDGQLEIFTTPSLPNRFDGKPQPGEVFAYVRTDDGFEQAIVEEFPKRHVKEILFTKALDEPVLLAAVEAELGKRPSGAPDARKTLIKRYRYEEGAYVGAVVATLPDKLLRFLNMGDVDGDGSAELIASTHKRGLYLVEPGAALWETKALDRDSGGFEHATVLADLDGNDVPEIYVAADKQQELRRHQWSRGSFDSAVLYEIEDDKLNFFVFAGTW